MNKWSKAAARRSLNHLFEEDHYLSDHSGYVSNSERPANDTMVSEFDQLGFGSTTSNVEGPSTFNRSMGAYSTSDLQSLSDKSSTTGPRNNEAVSNVERVLRETSTSIISEDCSLGSFSSQVTLNMDYKRLKSEHRKLQKHFEMARNDRFNAPSIRETVKRLSSCSSVSLDLFKRKEDKLELLNESLKSSDFDVVVTVILFLKRTLSNAIFRNMLISKPEAVEFYIAFLKESGDFPELIDTLFSLGRIEEAAMLEFSLAARRKQPQQKIQSLKKCLISGFSDHALHVETKHLRDFVNLLERQAADDEASKAGMEVSGAFKKFPKSATLVGKSMLTTLYYCCLYHYDMPSNSFASPLSLKEVFNLSAKEFTWVAVTALGRLGRFGEIEKLLTCKKLITGFKLVCPFPWPAFFSILQKHGFPPKEFLLKWVRAVTDLDERLQVCEQLGPICTEVEMETLVVMKDRVRLEALLSKLNPSGPEHSRVQQVLHSQAPKWKN